MRHIFVYEWPYIEWVNFNIFDGTSTMTFVLISSNTYARLRLIIALKIGMLDVKNVKKHIYFAFSQFVTFSHPEVLKMYLLLHFLRFWAETFRLHHKYEFWLTLRKRFSIKTLIAGATPIFHKHSGLLAKNGHGFGYGCFIKNILVTKARNGICDVTWKFQLKI